MYYISYGLNGGQARKLLHRLLKRIHEDRGLLTSVDPRNLRKSDCFPLFSNRWGPSCHGALKFSEKSPVSYNRLRVQFCAPWSFHSVFRNVPCMQVPKEYSRRIKLNLQAAQLQSETKVPTWVHTLGQFGKFSGLFLPLSEVVLSIWSSLPNQECHPEKPHLCLSLVPSTRLGTLLEVVRWMLLQSLSAVCLVVIKHILILFSRALSGRLWRDSKKRRPVSMNVWRISWNQRRVRQKVVGDFGFPAEP